MEISSEASALAILIAGFVIGMRHALDADHLAAVSTIVSGRRSLWSMPFVGGLWGIGHTVALFAVGALVVMLKINISGVAEKYLEAAVGLMLIFLGANVVRKLFRAEKLHAHEHSHKGHGHTHIHIHTSEEREHHGFGIRSVIIGMIHGLAGSAGLMLLILPTIDSRPLALIFILVFGIGSIFGMILMSFLMGIPLHFTAARFNNLNKGLRAAAGIFSLLWGFIIIGQKLFTV